MSDNFAISAYFLTISIPWRAVARKVQGWHKTTLVILVCNTSKNADTIMYILVKMNLPDTKIR